MSHLGSADASAQYLCPYLRNINPAYAGEEVLKMCSAWLTTAVLTHLSHAILAMLVYGSRKACRNML